MSREKHLNASRVGTPSPSSKHGLDVAWIIAGSRLFVFSENYIVLLSVFFLKLPFNYLPFVKQNTPRELYPSVPTMPPQ